KEQVASSLSAIMLQAGPQLGSDPREFFPPGMNVSTTSDRPSNGVNVHITTRGQIGAATYALRKWVSFFARPPLPCLGATTSKMPPKARCPSSTDSSGSYFPNEHERRSACRGLRSTQRTELSGLGPLRHPWATRSSVAIPTCPRGRRGAGCGGQALCWCLPSPPNLPQGAAGASRAGCP